MSGRILAILLILSGCLMFTGFAGAEEGRDIDRVTVVYSGNLQGKLRPTSICGGGLSGGFARRAYVLNSMKTEGKEILMVDNGGLFPGPARQNQKMRADLALKLYDEIGLDVLNLGPEEFYFGSGYLAEASENLSYPIISSNLISESSAWLHRSVIVEKGGLKMGILGVMPEDAFADQADLQMAEGFRIVSPEEALGELIPEMEKQTDVIILLSRLNEEQTAELVKAFPALNIAVASSRKKICESPVDLDKIVASSGVNGHFLLSAEVEKDEYGVRISRNQPLALDRPDNLDKSIEEYIAAAIDQRMAEIREQRRQMRKHKTAPGLTPEEFRRRIAEQQAVLEKKKEAGQEKKPGGEESEGEVIEGVILKYNGREIPADIRIIRKNKKAGKKEDME
ncbi:MAG: hypothetical protein R6V20_08690 [Desulfobia sp.]